MTKVHIGCSGFYYKEWKEVFYPKGLPQKSWFEYYTSRFNTIELNSTFYRFPTTASLEKWYNTSPAGFTFSAKVPKVITHLKRFNECEKYMQDFYTLIRDGLKEKLGCVLFQLHPQIQYSEQTLERILTLTDSRFKNVVEFRHESWWNENVLKRLSENKIVFCSISYPKLPDPVQATTPVLYYRFHGIPVLYKSLYDQKFLENKIAELKKVTNVKEIWIYFNNTWGTSAIQNAALVLEKFSRA